MHKILTTLTTTTTFLLLLLSTTTTAYIIPQPPPPPAQNHTLHPRTTSSPLSQLLLIVPSATTCALSPIPSECALASSALSPLISSFTKYSILTAPEQAALLSWMAYESAEFKYNKNHFPSPGIPGQGTRCMMSPAYVKEYVSSIPELASKMGGLSDAAVLGLVEGDEYSFGAAGWFYENKCGAQIKEGVKSGGKSGWAGFVTGCVGTVVDEGVGDSSREAYWRRAMGALGVAVS